MSSAAVVIGALRVNCISLFSISNFCKINFSEGVGGGGGGEEGGGGSNMGLFIPGYSDNFANLISLRLTHYVDKYY